jgi:hypothetical protein
MSAAAVGPKEVAVPPRKYKTEDWPLYAQLLERFGFATCWSIVLVYLGCTAVSWLATEVVKPAVGSVIQTHEVMRDAVTEQTRISSEMVNIQRQNTAILVEIKDSLTEGGRR